MTWRLGPYRVDDQPFAAGATAEVFGARRGRSGPRVAIKVLPLRTFRVRAEAEAEVAAIDHPRLLSVLERVEDERRGVVGLVMDLAADGDLRNALRGPNAPSPLEMLQITDDVLAALEALHGVGLVHRDIKPENVMLDRTDGALRARLGDMGIARQADRTRSTGSVLGTDLYIAPEVHDGAAPSPRADLWAVGYVLYEGLFGAPPHASASTTYQAIGRLRADGPDRPPKVPDAIWRVVASLLSPRPADRPPSASAARALVRTAQPAAAVSSPSVVSPGATLRRRPTPARPESERAVRYRRSSGLKRVLSVSAATALVVGALAWVGGRDHLQLFDTNPPNLGAVSSVAPLPVESPRVVPTQYQWRLRNGVLTGRVDVRNQSDAPTEATTLPELFPRSASTRGSLALVGFDGPTEREKDGSTLVRFAVPPLAPGASHVVAFRVTLDRSDDDQRALAQLVHDRQAAINRHAFALSDAPTLDHIVVTVAPSLVVGQQAQVHIQGFERTGSTASEELMRGLHVVVVSGQDVARVDGTSLAALAPGNAVIRAVVGDIQAEAPVSVASAPAPPPTTAGPRVVKKRTVTPTTDTTAVQEEPPPPESVIV